MGERKPQQPSPEADQERWLRSLVETAGQAIVGVSSAGQIVTWNREALLTFGYSGEEIIGQHLSTLMRPEAADANRDLLASLTSLEQPKKFRIVIACKDNRSLNVALTAAPVLDDAFGKSGLSLIIAEGSAAEEGQTFRLVVEAAPNGMVMVDSEGLIVLVNSQAERLFGYKREEIIGKPIEILVPGRFREAHPSYRAGFHKDPQVRPMGAGRELYGLRKDGTEVPVEIGLNPLITESRKFVLASIVDITERKRVEEMVRARDKALQESELKSAFVATISHELRTPLTSILGMNELLLHTKLTKQQQELAEAVQQSAQSLLRVVNDILDLSKIEAGKVGLESLQVSIEAIVGEVSSVLRPAAFKKNLKLVTSIDPRIPEKLMADPGRIIQVLLNLVSNAIKFTEQGQISVAVAIEAEQDESIVLRFAVSDTGVGLLSEDQDTIFKPFTQEDSSTRRKYGGTGLGLAISKHLVELMGGKIGVTSSKGRGATFWFTVPLLLAEEVRLLKEEHRPVEDLRRLSRSRVLVVEDDVLLQAMASQQLETLGVVGAVVATGQEALDALESGSYDLILMDCHLPFMDGFEATRLIRERESGTGRHIPVVAMTAAAMSGDVERCMQSGMDDYLSKPYTLNQLLKILERWLNVPALKPRGRGGQASRSSSDKRSVAAAADMPSVRYVNFERLSDDWAEADLMNFLTLFKSHADSLVKSLRDAWRSKKGKRLAELAHKLKGASSMIYATEVEECCRRLQISAEREEWDELSTCLDELSNVLVQTVRQIDAYRTDPTAGQDSRP